MSRRTIVLSLLLICCVFLAGCGVSVPEVVGTNLDEATAVIETAGFVVGSVVYDAESSEPQGTVARQEPAGGSRAKEGSTIDLTIAGPPPVPVPDLSGLDRQGAVAALSAEGLELGEINEVFDEAVPQGHIRSQEPTAGAVVPVGTAISLQMSKGPEPVLVPDVQGKSEAEALKLMETAGFTVDVVTKYDSAAKGTVLAQSAGPGTLQVPGTPVTITISAGPELVRVPDARDFQGSYNGDDFERVLSSLKQAVVEGFRKAGLSANVEFISGWDTSGGGWETGLTEYEQDPKPGSMVPKGTRVRVRIPYYS